MPGHILIVDDDSAMGTVLKTGLKGQGYTCTYCSSAEEALERADQEAFDAVLTDLRLGGGMDGVALCQKLKELRPRLPTIVMTAFGSLDAAVAAIRAGAYDFITKPVEMDFLGIALDRAIKHRGLTVEVEQLRREVSAARGFGKIVGESPGMRQVCDLIQRIADTDTPVLIVGDTGTGKELVAQALHEASARSDGPFQALNCAAVPENLIEDELFGHVHGAFTGTRGTRPGLFASARGGTLFLDEIGDMPLALQPKLLRVLQERRFRPVGSDKEVDTNVRVVTATHRDLDAEIAAGRFRQDLFYRLAVMQIELPPLKDRGNDVLLLAQHFLEKTAEDAKRPVSGFSLEATQKLITYDWPGNVRELQNCVERAVVLARGDRVAAEDLSPRVQRTVAAVPRPAELLPLEVVERRHILGVLQHVGGKRGRAAEVLDIDRKTLYRKLSSWGFEEGEDPEV